MHYVKDLSPFIAYLLTFIPYCVLFCVVCMRQEIVNEQYRNTLKDLLLPISVSRKDEKLHTVRLYDAMILHVKIAITKIILQEKSLIPQYHKPQRPPLIFFVVQFL